MHAWIKILNIQSRFLVTEMDKERFAKHPRAKYLRHFDCIQLQLAGRNHVRLYPNGKCTLNGGASYREHTELVHNFLYIVQEHYPQACVTHFEIINVMGQGFIGFDPSLMRDHRKQRIFTKSYLAVRHGPRMSYVDEIISCIFFKKANNDKHLCTYNFNHRLNGEFTFLGLKNTFQLGRVLHDAISLFSFSVAF